MNSLHKIFPRGRGGYPAISIHGQKIMIHVLLVMYWIGGNVPESLVIHHVNEDIFDARKENLKLTNKIDHCRFHNFGPHATRWRSCALHEIDPDHLADLRIVEFHEVQKEPEDLPF